MKYSTTEVNLSGRWEMGIDREYEKTVHVPGIATDAKKKTPGTLWYRRRVQLPGGDWRYATLVLKGACFMPEVWVNGQKVSKARGGMAPTFHPLMHEAIMPGEIITLEIALKSLKDVPEEDPSYVPPTAHWRTNISSWIWDDVILQTHGNYRIERIIPFTRMQDKQVDVHWDLQHIAGDKTLPDEVVVEIFDAKSNILVRETDEVISQNGEITIPYGDKCKPWSPEQPNVYKLRLTMKRGGNDIAQDTLNYAPKDFRLSDNKKGLLLNGKPCQLRGGVICWYKWSGDKEAWPLIHNYKWLLENVIIPLKDRGANYLRIQMGSPPERILDMCDRYGLHVQYEWHFFHNCSRAQSDLEEQWGRWLDLGIRHPSVSIIHGWTEAEPTKQAWTALEKLEKRYPPLVIAHRDTEHPHHYWWSLFENLDLTYDEHRFSKVTIVDEFGGNYLDGDLNLGGYPAQKSAALRFLGPNHTPELRLELQNLSNARIAEYWRRLGVNGINPYCILGIFEDGCHWYLGPLKEGRLKPVWNALTATWSPRSVSIEIWDRNFTTSQRITLPVYFFNDTDKSVKLKVDLKITDMQGETISKKNLEVLVNAFSQERRQVQINAPEREGRYTFNATLLNPTKQVKVPVVSEWDFFVIKAKVPTALKGKRVGVHSLDVELEDMCKAHGLTTVKLDDDSADVLVTSSHVWARIAEGDAQLKHVLDKALNKKQPVVMLDVNLTKEVTKESEKVVPFLGNTRLRFKRVGQTESHFHPATGEAQKVLWRRLDRRQTWLWNGRRGGLIAPDVDIQVELGREAFKHQWKKRGADMTRIESDSYYAYELEGHYHFSNKPDDKAVIDALFKEVLLALKDAPAVAEFIGPETVTVVDLANTYKKLGHFSVTVEPLAVCGKDLYRVPVFSMSFAGDGGGLIVSQLLTEGRLASGFGSEGLYGVRYDEAAVQFVLNLLGAAIN